MTGNVELKDRTLAFFSDSTYAVMYENDKYHVWYYTNSGNLIYAEEKINWITHINHTNMTRQAN